MDAFAETLSQIVIDDGRKHQVFGVLAPLHIADMRYMLLGNETDDAFRSHRLQRQVNLWLGHVCLLGNESFVNEAVVDEQPAVVA